MQSKRTKSGRSGVKPRIQIFLLLLTFAAIIGLSEVSEFMDGKWSSMGMVAHFFLLGCMITVCLWISGGLDGPSKRKMKEPFSSSQWQKLTFKQKTRFILGTVLIVVVFIMYYPIRLSLMALLSFIHLSLIIFYFSDIRERLHQD